MSGDIVKPMYYVHMSYVLNLKRVLILSHSLAQILVDFAHLCTHLVNWLSPSWLLTNVMEVLTQS